MSPSLLLSGHREATHDRREWTSMAPWTYYWISVALLAGLLFWPVSKLVWALSVRRLERRLGQPLSERERAGQLNRARLLAIVLCVVFSALFNYQILDMSAHG